MKEIIYNSPEFQAWNGRPKQPPVEVMSAIILSQVIDSAAKATRLIWSDEPGKPGQWRQVIDAEKFIQALERFKYGK